MARPTDLAPELADQIARFVRAGNWQATAARAAGVPERTFYRWMARGRAAEDKRQDDELVLDSEQPFWQLWQQVTRAEAESELIAVNYLMKEIPRSPTAAIHFLERRFHGRWGRRDHRQVELSGVDGAPIQVQSGARERIAAKLQEMHARGVFARPAGVDGHERQTDSDEGAEPTSDEQRVRVSRVEREGPSFA